MRLYLDGQFVGRIGNGSTLEVPVSPGHHEVLARTMFMYSSRVLPIEVRVGESLDVEVGSNASGWRVVVSAVFLFARSDYLYLRFKSPRSDEEHHQARKKDLLIGALMVGLLGVMCLGGCGLLVAWFESTTGNAAMAADRFLALLGEGKVAEAYNSTATKLRDQESREAFANSVRQLGLTDYASSSWPSRKVDNGVVTFEGSLMTRAGGTIPLTIVLINESGSWRVLSVKALGRGH